MIVTFKDPAMLVGNLKAALLAACEDPTWAHMNCVRVEIRPGVARFVATDGHMMWINEIACEESIGVDEKGKIVFGTSEAIFALANDDAHKLVKTLDTKRGWAVEIDTEARVVRQLNQSIGFRVVEGTFPPYRAVIPAQVGGDRIVATFDAQLMARISMAFVYAAGRATGKAARVKAIANEVPVSVHTTSDGKYGPEPIVITCSAFTPAAHALVVLMPYCKSDSAADRGPEALLAKYSERKPKEAAA